MNERLALLEADRERLHHNMRPIENSRRPVTDCGSSSGHQWNGVALYSTAECAAIAELFRMGLFSRDSGTYKI